MLMLMGPAGVGKTEVVTALGDAMHDGDKRGFHRVEGPQYGPGSGKTGNDLIREMSMAAQKKRFSKVLIDEIEKMAPEVQNALLAIGDSGLANLVEDADSSGKRKIVRQINFRNTRISFTTNAGQDLVKKYGASIDWDTFSHTDEFRNKMVADGVGAFLLNRTRPIPHFPPTEGEFRKITEIHIKNTLNKIQNQQKRLKIELAGKQELIDGIVERYFKAGMNPRSVVKKLQQELPLLVAKQIQLSKVQIGTCIVDMKEVVKKIVLGGPPTF